MVARNKYGGYRNKTRSMVDSGGLCSLRWLAQQNILSQYHQNRATTLACFHKYLVTPPCQKRPVLTGTSKTGAHSWMLTNYACCKMHARENDYMNMHAWNISTHMKFLLRTNKPCIKYSSKHSPYQVFKMLALNMQKHLVYTKSFENIISPPFSYFKNT